MLSRLPPTRWRVVERGRRLITVDAVTGQEIGLGANLPPIDLNGTPRLRQAKPAQRATLAAPAQASVPAVKGGSRAAAPERSTTLPSTMPAGHYNANKLILLVVGSVFLLFILIFSGAWIFAAAALFFAPVRQALTPVGAKLNAWLKAS